MFGKLKRWLGIEGVKVELHIPEKVKASMMGVVEGAGTVLFNARPGSEIDAGQADRKIQARPTRQQTRG